MTGAFAATDVVFFAAVFGGDFFAGPFFFGAVAFVFFSAASIVDFFVGILGFDLQPLHAVFLELILREHIQNGMLKHLLRPLLTELANAHSFNASRTV